MRRIDTVKNRKMKNIKHVEILHKDLLRVVFKNNCAIDLKVRLEDYGEDAGIYIMDETYEKPCERCAGYGHLFTPMLTEIDCNVCKGKGVVTVVKEENYQ